ncbi:MAG: TraR/DksA family transcriptional regulator [Bacteroidia bacterium]
MANKNKKKNSPGKNAKKVKAKKAVAKKPMKKAVAKKPVKKAVAKKPVKKVVAKKPVKKVVAKKPVKKVVAKKPVKKVVAKKPVKKVVAKKPVKKVVAKKPVKKVIAKKTVKKVIAKPVIKKIEKPELKKAFRPAQVAVPSKPMEEPKHVEVPTKHVTITIDKTIEERKPTPAKDIHFPESKEETVEVFESKRYSDADLAEFKEIINKKLVVAREELANLIEQMQNPGINAAADTDNAYKTLEDGASTAEKEYVSQLAARQRKFIENLENALVRIENKTYGICRVTGKLISKERLRAVPHTTLSMEAKLQQYK